MMKLNFKNTFASAAILTSMSIAATSAYAQSAVEPWTGAIPGDNVYFANNDGLKQIRSMLNDGEIDKAVTFAKAYVQSSEADSRSGKTSSMRYDAYNALCLAYTAQKNYDAAKEACNTAIKDTPNGWLAYNSRGSLNLKMGNASEANNDYRMALENAPEKGDIKIILEHNINLAQNQ
ncbi:MAG: hypothetical protein P8O77_09770 [Emcibacteraceae bacterium]|nr:hypothetical protein [Emcibacteraceae bacterium]